MVEPIPSPQDEKKDIPVINALQSVVDIAKLIGIESRELIRVLYKTPKEEQYTTFSIPKNSGGKRTICAPSPELKDIQKRLNKVLQKVYEPKAATQGFVAERSILTNARRHRKRKKRFIYNIDLMDFFPSISFSRVKGMFMSIPYSVPPAGALILAQICCYQNQLPQGAPTSPTISNMLCSKMDSQLTRLSQKYRCTYTRYADDISISTSLSHFPEALIKELNEIITANGFLINSEKTRLLNRYRRQEITGLLINEFPNVKRNYIRQIRAMLHAWAKYGLEAANKEHNKKYRFIENEEKFVDFRRVLRGKLDFLSSIRGTSDTVYRKLYDKARKLEEDTNIQRENRFFTKIVQADPSSVAKDRYALVVGINRYLDPNINPLEYCVNDANDFAKALRDLGYTTVKIMHDEMSDQNLRPLRNTVESTLDTLCKTASEDDFLLVYFACHGKSINGKAYLYMYDTYQNMLEKRGWPLQEIESQIKESKAKLKFLIIDACHVGVGREVGTPDIEEFNKIIQQSEGFALLSASTAEQIALEDKATKHGLFTYFLIQGMSGKAKAEGYDFLTVDELYDYVFKSLRRWALNQNPPREFQKPAQRKEGFGKFVL